MARRFETRLLIANWVRSPGEQLVMIAAPERLGIEAADRQPDLVVMEASLQPCQTIHSVETARLHAPFAACVVFGKNITFDLHERLIGLEATAIADNPGSAVVGQWLSAMVEYLRSVPCSLAAR